MFPASLESYLCAQIAIAISKIHVFTDTFVCKVYLQTWYKMYMYK